MILDTIVTLAVGLERNNFKSDYLNTPLNGIDNESDSDCDNDN